MKKELYIVSWEGISDVGGVERVTRYLVKAWSPLYDVVVVDYETLKKKPFCKSLLKRRTMIDGVVFSLFVNKVKRKKSDAKIVIQGYNCPFVSADIAIAHGTMRGYQIKCLNSKKWNTSQLYEKWGQKRSKKVIAVGEHVKREVVDLYGIDEKKVFVIENCVDANLFFPIDHEENKYYTILFAGRLSEGKGLSDLLRLAEIIEDKNEFRLMIATNSINNVSLFDKYNNTTVKMGINGYEMNDFYNSGDVMFFPSKYEGFEMVTTECLSSGVPVVGNNVGALGDLFERKQAGVAIISGSINDDLDMMKEMATKYRDYQARLKLHNGIEEMYGIEKYIKKICSVWE